MLCPICKKANIEEQSINYKCPSCGFIINKVILKKVITQDMLKDLCQNGRTQIVKGFISKKGKPFEAALRLDGNKIVFDFNDNKVSDSIINLRINSSSPGMVNINITGIIVYSATVDFGLVSTRMAECLGTIAAVKYLRHKNITGKILISANNREFIEYALRETTPRQKEMRFAISHLWQTLEPFSWSITYDRQRRSKLQGGSTNKPFPQSLFPWLKLEKTVVGNEIYVVLPDCPAVQAQITASIKTARKEGGNLVVPMSAEPVLKAWEMAVGA